MKLSGGQYVIDQTRYEDEVKLGDDLFSERYEFFSPRRGLVHRWRYFYAGLYIEKSKSIDIKTIKK